jgi:hypothetical protein
MRLLFRSAAAELLLMCCWFEPRNIRDFPTAYKDYPGGVEYFEVYHGPLKTTYSQVWWTSTANALPDEFVQRFDGKAIAIVGLEMDQVRRTPHGDVRVPITMSYNHHHDTAVVGKRSELVEVPRDSAAFRAAGRDYIRLDGMKAWVAKEHTRSTSGLPSSAMFSDGNGVRVQRLEPRPSRARRTPKVTVALETLSARTGRVPEELSCIRTAVRADRRVAHTARGGA